MVDRQMRYLAVSRQWLKDFALEEENIIGRECNLERRAREREAIAETIGGEWLSQPWRDDWGEIAGTIFSVLPRPALANHHGVEREPRAVCQFIWYRPYSHPPILEVVREAKNMLLPS